MTEQQIDLDALEAEYGDYAATEEVKTVRALIAELRQERERAGVLLDKAGEIAQQNQNLVEVRLALEAALSRAEEAIEKALGATDMAGEWVIWDSGEAYDILTEYDKQKEADR